MLKGDEVWSKVQKSLQQNLSKPSYETWIRPAQFSEFKDGVLTLLAPNPFSCNYLRKNYSKTIEDLAEEACGKSLKIEFKSLEDDSSVTQKSPKRTSLPVTAELEQPFQTSTKSLSPNVPSLNSKYVFNRVGKSLICILQKK